MKKLILNLGLTTLAILPVVAIASCSATSIETPSIKMEVEKFKNPFSANEASKAATVSQTVKSINAVPELEKLAALGKIITLPAMNSAFTYKVGLAKIDSNNNSVIVPITITQTLIPTNTEIVEIKIIGLATSSKLEQEIAKFQISLVANTTSKAKDATTIVKEINTATDKVATLKTIVDNLPEVSNGFTMSVGVAMVDKATPTSVNIPIAITQESDKTTEPSILTITGLKESTELLDKEVSKFADPHQTTWKTDPTTAINTINEAVDNQAKINLLKQHITDFPTLEAGFSLTVGQAAEVNGSVNSIMVVLKITQTSNQASKDVSLVILGFEELPAKPLESL